MSAGHDPQADDMHALPDHVARWHATGAWLPN